MVSPVLYVGGGGSLLEGGEAGLQLHVLLYAWQRVSSRAFSYLGRRVSHAFEFTRTQWDAAAHRAHLG